SLRRAATYALRLREAREARTAGDALTAARCVREARSTPRYERAHEAVQEWASLYRCLYRSKLRAVWEVNSSSQVNPLLHAPSSVLALHIAPDGQHVLVGYTSQVTKWNLDTRTIVSASKVDIHEMCVAHPAGRLV